MALSSLLLTIVRGSYLPSLGARQLSWNASLTTSTSGLLGAAASSMVSRHNWTETERFGRASSVGIATPGRAKRGIYGGRSILSGNMISFSNRKTRRTWKPNVHEKRFPSHLLERTLSIKVTSHALRCIEKYGGIDAYLMYGKPAHVLESQLAETLRRDMINAWQLRTGLKWHRRTVIYLQRVRAALTAEKAHADWVASGKEGAEPPRYQRRHWIPYDIELLKVQSPSFDASKVYYDPTGRLKPLLLTLRPVSGVPHPPKTPKPSFLFNQEQQPQQRLVDAQSPA